ncbi:hypothetical protein CROQUDRAFT_656311 [Cronartium quercuum f. sp. fusiforme G11]|uniref:mRNA cap guanine-N(7) methyltransferase n=1 Tax=Cronartium quercuum f. sp. fusiforme G11 TaxID=708437 RepID=A0A9P6TD07_9BASI|nr:hypothetical protein CROQUDRAFT_656311 [Cronartium quercuum f. sp. fusiforme G11]
MDQIAYHPVRVSPPTSLFLPYTDQELKLYEDRSANPLFRRPAPSGNTYRPPHLRNPQACVPQSINSGLRPGGMEQSQRVGPVTQSLSAWPLPQHLHHPTPSQEPVTVHRAGSLRPPPEPNALPIQQPVSGLPQRPVPQPGPESRMPPRENEQASATHRSPPYYSTPSPLVITGSPKSYPRDEVLMDGKQSISEAVAEHYNARPNQGKDARVESPIFGLRKFNNWIKSVIIGKFAAKDSPTIKAIQGRRFKGTKVLELGCGKGGDLAKWQKAGVEELYGFDIAKVSVEQAEQRYQDGSRHKFSAKFTALDCFTVDISTVLKPKELARPFDAVSLQFCMHYAFESEAKVRTMLRNVSANLIKGGVFIGTIPDPDLLLRRLDAMNGSSTAWGNPVYEVRFQALQPRPVFGYKYNFYLKDAVEHVPEYVVFWEPFVQLAAEYGLELVFKEGFHSIFEHERHTNHHRQLLTRMEVTDSGGQCLMSNDQWEAAGLYLAFAFIKK